MHKGQRQSLLYCLQRNILSGKHFFLELSNIAHSPLQNSSQEELDRVLLTQVAVPQEKYSFGDRLHPLSVVTE